MKKYNVNVHYDYCACVQVEAESEDEAIDKAKEIANEMSADELEYYTFRDACITNSEKL